MIIYLMYWLINYKQSFHLYLKIQNFSSYLEEILF